MKLPDFLIIGAAKSGSTSLYRHLQKHPNIFMSEPKEPCFFSIDERFDRGLNWYSSLFQNAPDDHLCGEASTNYSNVTAHPKTVERIAATLPNAKFIYIMRHPVDRSYSYYLQLISNKIEADKEFKFQKSFEEQIKEYPSIIESSNYMLQINEYLKYFDQKRFLFLFDHDLHANIHNVVTRVTEHFGVTNKTSPPQNTNSKQNVTAQKNYWLIREKFFEPIQKIPGVSQLASLIPTPVKDRLFRVLENTPRRKRLEHEYIPAKMLPETRTNLLAYFQKSNHDLEQFLGTKLPQKWYT